MQSITILLAEDEPSWQEKIREILEQAGHTVKVASSYAEAYNRFVSERFELVVVDLKLGPEADNRDGVSLLEDAFTKGIPAIVVTGYGTRDMIKKANRYDVMRFMHKAGFKSDELGQVISEVTNATVSRARLPTPQEAKEVKELLRKLAAGWVI